MKTLKSILLLTTSLPVLGGAASAYAQERIPNVPPVITPASLSFQQYDIDFAVNVSKAGQKLVCDITSSTPVYKWVDIASVAYTETWPGGYGCSDCYPEYVPRTVTTHDNKWTGQFTAQKVTREPTIEDLRFMQSYPNGAFKANNSYYGSDCQRTDEYCSDIKVSCRKVPSGMSPVHEMSANQRTCVRYQLDELKKSLSDKSTVQFVRDTIGKKKVVVNLADASGSDASANAGLGVNLDASSDGILNVNIALDSEGRCVDTPADGDNGLDATFENWGLKRAVQQAVVPRAKTVPSEAAISGDDRKAHLLASLVHRLDAWAEPEKANAVPVR